MNELREVREATGQGQAGPTRRVGRRLAVLLGLVLLGATVVRSIGLDFALPFAYASVDESIVTDRARAFADGDLDPDYFFYPTFPMYQVGACFEAWARLAPAIDRADDAAEVRERYYLDPTGHFLIARGYTVLLSVLAVLATAWLAHELVRHLHRGDSRAGNGPALTAAIAGCFAAALLAVNPLHAHLSRYVQLDTPLSLWAALAATATLRHSRTRSHRSLVAACVATGLAASTKYYGALLALPIGGLLASGLHGRDRGSPARLRQLAFRWSIAGAITVICFLAASPYIALNFAGFRRDFGDLLLHNQELGHFGQEIPLNGFVAYAKMLWEPWGGVALCLAGALGVMLLVSQRRGWWPTVLLLGFPFVFYVCIGRMRAQFPGYLCAMLPALAACGGYGLARLTTGWSRPGLQLATGFVLAWLLVPDALRTGRRALEHRWPDSRNLLREWAAEHLPDGAVVATDTWPDLPLSVDCLESMQRAIDATARGEPPPPGTERSHGPLTEAHVLAQLEHARSRPTEKRRFDVAQVPPLFMDPAFFPRMLDADIRYVLCTQSRFQPILEGEARRDPEYLRNNPAYARRVDYYERLLSGDLEIARFPSGDERAQGPVLVLCDLQRLGATADEHQAP